LIQILFEFQRPGELPGRAVALLMPVVLNDGIAYRDAFVADIGARIVAGGRDELANYILPGFTV